MSRRSWVVAGLVAGLACVGVGMVAVSWSRAERAFREELAAATADLDAGRTSEAKLRLTRLNDGWPGRPEVAYQWGRAELARGRMAEALAAWERVPWNAPEGPRAAVDRGALLFRTGHHSEAERLLTPALDLPPPLGTEARFSLNRIRRMEGRMDEVRTLLERPGGAAAEWISRLVELWYIEHGGYPVEGVRRALDAADPDDDRIWLGRANMALRLGRNDEAAEWLGRCQARRPEDSAVWRGWLDWSRAVGDTDQARRALDHLPAEGFDTTEVLALRAWFASVRGDTAGERAALEKVAEIGPRRGKALERLVELAKAAGQPDRVADLRRRKAREDEALESYRKKVTAADPKPDAAELARLAEELGLRFEARSWAEIAAHDGSEPARAMLARLDRTPPPAVPSGQTLAQRLALAQGEPTTPTTGAPSTRSLAADRVLLPDDAEGAGLRFSFQDGQSPERQLPESMAGGVGVLDFDSDGWLDVYAIQGGPFPPDPAKAVAGAGDRLFRNKGDGTFEDATARSGIGGFPGGYGQGIAVGDFDNDGHPDIFLTRWRSYALYRNKGDGTFEDATARAGLAGDRDWPTSCAWADLDGDGDLDLYVCHYLDWDTEHPKTCYDAQAKVNKYCDPRLFTPRPDHLFRNDGGRFVDVTTEAGIVDRDGRGLGVVANDLDGDGKVDLFVANDTSANYLFRNLGGFRFEEVGHDSGVASSANGSYLAGMGVACGDLDGDGLADLAVTNFYHESTTFYRNLGDGVFADQTEGVGLAATSRHLLGFGAGFLDADGDGRLDLLTVNGHVNDNGAFFAHAMPARLWLGSPSGRLVEALVSGPFEEARIGRGLAVADLDNDGRPDALAVALDRPLAYFHNRSAGGHSLTLRLEGTPSNRDGVGAVVTLVAGGRRQVRWRFGGGSYLSVGDPRIHFGLGDAKVADSVEVRWPSGHVDRFDHLPADAGYLVREGAEGPSPLTGFVKR